MVRRYNKQKLHKLILFIIKPTFYVRKYIFIICNQYKKFIIYVSTYNFKGLP